MGNIDDEVSRAAGPVVAIVPAKDRVDSVAATVEALAALDAVDRVLVVDDGSTDGTADAAKAAGADVLVLPRNLGKGGAVAAGVAASPDAAVFLLIDADLASTAAAADRLLGPVVSGEADLTIGVLPPAGGRGGFGAVKTLAAKGVRRASGLELRAPLSGQRAVRAEYLRDGLPSSRRFGLEVAMSIDVARAGGTVVEVEVPMDHRHTGRRLAGFAHRGRQGLDILGALWPRVTRQRNRIGAMVLLTLVVLAATLALGGKNVPASIPADGRARKVIVFGIEPFGFQDLARGVTPNLQRLVDQGAIGAMSVRGVSRVPSDSEGYLTMGAGARLAAVSNSSLVVPRDQSVGPMTAADYVEGRSGTLPKGPFVAVAGPALMQYNNGPQAASKPGTLATELAKHGISSAVVANSDHPALLKGDAATNRAAALAVMTSTFGIAHGAIDPGKLLSADPMAPFGTRANLRGFTDATVAALKRSDLVVVDPGDLTRAQSFSAGAIDAAKNEMWIRALRWTDQILGAVIAHAPPDTLVLVASVRAPHGEFRLTPVVAWGAGVTKGTLTSPSTQRSGVVPITDIAPTVLHAFGVTVPDDLPGNAFRYEPGKHDLGALETYDADTVVRERTYFGMSWLYIWSHAVVYGLILFVVARRPRFTSLRGALRFLLLSLGAIPVASFLVRLVPGLTSWFVQAQGIATVIIALAIGWFVSRRKAHALSALAWLCALTMVVTTVDVWFGSHLEMSSWLGYTLHGAGRFYGIPNTSFAVLGACAMVWAGIVVHHAEQRLDALWGVGCVLLVVMLTCSAPMLGANVGAGLTLAPVFALFVYVLTGRRLKLRNIVLAGLGMVALVVLGAAIDLARPAADRTHLGRFASDVLKNGPSVLFNTVFRKQGANVRISGSSLWTRLFPIIGVFLFHPLVWERRAREVFGGKRALRCVCWALIGAALLGFVTNDSGPLIISLFGVWMLPLVALILLDPSSGPAELAYADGRPSTWLRLGHDPDVVDEEFDVDLMGDGRSEPVTAGSS